MTDKTSDKGKKAAAIVLAAAVMAVSIGMAVHATASIDVPQKNVLITDNAIMGDYTAASEIQTTPSESTAVSSPITEEQAFEIAKNSLNQIFSVNPDNENFDTHAEYYDVKRLEAEIAYAEELNGSDISDFMIWETQLNAPFWNITFISPRVQRDRAAGEDGTSVRTNIEAFCVTIDAISGDVLRISRNPSGNPEKDPISEASIKARAVEFVESNNLAKGVSIKNIVVYDFDNIEVLLELEDGKFQYLMLGAETGQVLVYQGEIDSKLIEYLNNRNSYN